MLSGRSMGTVQTFPPPNLGMGEKKKTPIHQALQRSTGRNRFTEGWGGRQRLLNASLVTSFFFFGLSSVLLIVVCEKYKQALEEDILLFALLFLLVLYD